MARGPEKTAYAADGFVLPVLVVTVVVGEWADVRGARMVSLPVVFVVADFNSTVVAGDAIVCDVTGA